MLKYIQKLMAAIFLLIGLALLAYSLLGLYISYQAVDWKTIDGTISSIKFSQSSGPKQASTSAKKVEYVYSVEGREYLGNREFFGVLIGTNKQTSGGYRKGSSVKIFYDPNNPKNSVLKPKYRKNIWIGVVFSMPFCLFGMYGLRELHRT